MEQNKAFLQIENLSFSYGDKEILKNFTAYLGPQTALQGPSGRGKSTLLKIVAGLLQYNTGRGFCGAKKPTLLFQDNRLFPGFTVLENVMAVCDSREKATKYLELTEIAELADKPWEELSGGQQRRASLARTLAYEGDLLLLDEPFNGLDPELTERIAKRIKALNIPYIISTHSEIERSLFPDAELLKL